MTSTPTTPLEVGSSPRSLRLDGSKGTFNSSSLLTRQFAQLKSGTPQTTPQTSPQTSPERDDLDIQESKSKVEEVKNSVTMREILNNDVLPNGKTNGKLQIETDNTSIATVTQEPHCNKQQDRATSTFTPIRYKGYIYPEFKSNPRNIIIGGFPQLAPKDIPVPASKPDRPAAPWRCFPPPEDSAYEGLGKKVEEDYDPQQLDAFDIALEGAGLAKINTNTKTEIHHQKEVPHTRPKLQHRRSDSSVMATQINFSRKSWVEEIPGASGPVYTADEQRDDFIKAIDEGAAIEYCKICKRIHIAPGSPITLPDRDTCGSHLPGWFPAETMVRPWAYFQDMINDYVRLSEIEQGYSHLQNPDRPIWNQEFHNSSDKWKEIAPHRVRGGWWKCRRGDNATQVEKFCKVCHSQEALSRDAEMRARKRRPTVAESKASIERWINEMVAKTGRRDKQIAQAMMRAEGIPQQFGNPYAKRMENFDGVNPHQRSHIPPELMFSARCLRQSPSCKNDGDEMENGILSDTGEDSYDSTSTYRTGKSPDGSPIRASKAVSSIPE